MTREGSTGEAEDEGDCTAMGTEDEKRTTGEECAANERVQTNGRRGADERTSVRERIRWLAQSSRARVPLALVGVLLLVGGVMLVAHVETQDEPAPNVDASLAIDRTESVTQTAVRDGIRRATETAAEQPLTDPADNEWGDVLAGGTSTGNTSSQLLSDDPFVNYLRALVYLEVEENLATAGQELGDVETRVSLPEVTNATEFERAIQRVHIEEPEEPGVLTVEITNVTLVAEHRGEEIERVEQDVQVSVVTPILELHEHVEAYEEALNTGITERGFTQRFNARIYGIGYLRGWAQNARAPVVEVIANRHIEPSANSALYRTQQDVFGAADPALQGAVQAGWTCMFMQDGEAFIGESEYSPDVGGEYLDSVDVDAETLCDVTDFVLDPEQGLELDPTEFIDELPGLGGNETLEVGNTASLPLAHMADPTNEQSFAAVLERIFTVDTSVETDVEVTSSLQFDHDCADSENPTEREQTSDPQVTVRGGERVDDPDGELYELTATVSVWVAEGCDDDSVMVDRDVDWLRMEVTSTVEASETSPDARIDYRHDTDTDYEFEPGPAEWEAPDRHTVPVDFQNYGGGVRDGITKNVLRAELWSGWSMDDAEFLAEHETCLWEVDSVEGLYDCWVSHVLYSTGEITSASDVRGLDTERQVLVDPREYLDGDVTALMEAMFEDIGGIRDSAAEINHTFERKELLETGENNPFSRLIEEIDAVQDEYTSRESYANVGEKAVYEARLAYFELLKSQFGWVESAHVGALQQMENELDDVVDDMDEALDFLTQGTNDPEPEDTEMQSSGLTDDVTFEVSGSPTYLEATNLTSEDVPAIDQGVEFVPLAMRNEDHIDLPYENVIDSLLGKIADLVGLGNPDAELSFRMAGDVLEAADRAQQAEDFTARIDDPDEFEDTVGEFRASVDEGIDDFEERAADEITRALYDERVAYCVIEAPDGWLEHLQAASDEMWEATKAAFVMLTDPHDLAEWTASNLVGAVETLIEALEALDPRNWFGSDDPVEDAAEELAGEMSEDADELPFDPTQEEYTYGECIDDLHEVDEEYVDTIEAARDEIEAAVGDVIAESRAEDGIVGTADAIGRANITDEVGAAVEEVLADEAYVPDEWPSEYAEDDFEQWREIVESAVVPGVEHGASLRIDIGDPEEAEEIDESIQTALGTVADDIVDSRMGLDVDEDALRAYANETLVEMEEWVGDWAGQQTRAARVPAGLPLLPIPGHWYATVNAWDVRVAGEYARFEATANVGTPDTTTSTTYVREDQSVEYEIGGERRELGTVDSITFDGWSVLIVVVPPGVGVGDRDDENPECSPTYPVTGELDTDEIGC